MRNGARTKSYRPITEKTIKSMKEKKQKKNPNAVALGRLGGKAVSKKLGKKGRIALAKKGATARWSHRSGENNEVK